MTQPRVGDKVKVIGIRWHEPEWEFDCPVVIISPVIRICEDGSSIDQLRESLLIDVCIDGKWPKSEADPKHWRGWSPAYLKRKQYRKDVQREVVEVEFILDGCGELFWREREIEP
jgi:hypothetical protein